MGDQHGRLATAAVIVQTLLAISPEYPPPDPAAAGLMAQARAELLAERPGTT